VRKSGRDLSHIDFYVTFAFYKIGVILQQIYYRWKQGQTKDEKFGEVLLFFIPIEAYGSRDLSYEIHSIN
jgi:aminoglycoside phosphotransferase (APT) family kinase protein